MDIAQQLQQLYGQFGQLDGINIELHKELIAIEVENEAAKALIFLQGAQIAEYQAHGQAKTLWLSDANSFQAGKPLRGGIPICWPWFGELADNRQSIQQQFKCGDRSVADYPAHGFVRSKLWQLQDITELNPTQTQLVFKLKLDGQQPSIWPYACELSLSLTVGSQLDIRFEVSNTGDETFQYSSALHSYFSVADINQSQVTGLDNCYYLDKTQQFKRRQQREELSINDEIDRIYDSGTINSIGINNQQQRTELNSSGSASTVVWNPGPQGAKQLSHFNDDDYLRMICVETANTGDDYVELAPKKSKKIELSLKTESLS